MEKHQIQLLHPQTLQAAVNKMFHILGGIPFGGEGIQAPAALGNNKEMVLVLCDELPNGPLAVAVVINIGGVDEVDAAFVAGL